MQTACVTTTTTAVRRRTKSITRHPALRSLLPVDGTRKSESSLEFGARLGGRVHALLYGALRKIELAELALFIS